MVVEEQEVVVVLVVVLLVLFSLEDMLYDGFLMKSTGVHDGMVVEGGLGLLE